VKIGFLAPLSGAIAQAGKDMYSGCELYWEESGWQLAGRKLEVILEDNEGVPATALTRARKLVESDRVNMLAGVILSNVAYALVPYIEAQGIPTIYPINSADDLTQRRRPKWLIRTGFSAGGNMHPFGEYAAKVLGYKKIAIVSLDYAFGWEIAGGFQQTFEDNGGQVIQKLWVPLNVQDYAPYLTQIRKDADAVFVLALGRWTLLFAKQWATSGLKDKIPLRGHVHGRARPARARRRVDRRHQRPPLLGGARHARQPPLPRRVREEVRAHAVVLLGGLLHGGAGHRGGGQGRGRPRRGPSRLHGRAQGRRHFRRAPRARQDGPLRQSHPEHLHPKGRARGRQASEHRDLHLPGREPVLEVQPRGVPETARLLARLPALPPLLIARASRGASHAGPHRTLLHPERRLPEILELLERDP
jgi:hypothetical protein